MTLFKKGFVVTVLFSILVFAASTPANAQTPEPDRHPVYIYLFWGNGCPHCARAIPYFESLKDKYPEVVLRTYEIYYSAENQQFLAAMAELRGFEFQGVPTILIGPYYMAGYSEDYNQDIENLIVSCIRDGCPDAGEGLITETVTVQPTPTAVTETPVFETTPVPSTALHDATPPHGVENQKHTPAPALPASESPPSPSHLLQLPLLGAVDLDLQSTALSTVLIAFVDGVNPCSIWVLTMLLALTLHTGSRKKVMLIGLIFLTVTAAIYALFIAGLFSMLRVTSYMGWIRTLVALIALFFALVNIKDYFWYKEGLSFTISEEKKPGIFKRIRAVMDASQSFWGLAGATILLAGGVSMVEFSCTAGLPVLWTNLLTAQNVSAASFLFLLLLYMAVYQLDELAIFFSAVVSLKASRLEEKHGRILKLVGGILMLTLSIVMLVNPALMNTLASSLIIFGLSFLATLLVIFIHRLLLPKIGIRIGTELNKSGHARR